MEKSGDGGRPKADTWEHVTVLEGNRVKCKYCGFEFAASANRIKSHIHQIKGQGIRLCTHFRQLNNTDSHKEKQDLLNSQGLLIVDRPRDYNQLNERMVDCYMSPKTMWEGIKALQQVQIHTKVMHQERIKVGPFSVSIMVNEPDLQLIQYVFEHSCETVFSSPPRLYLKQYEFTTLRPQTHLDSLVIDIFAYILTDTERTNKRKSLNWYLPVMFSTQALKSGDISSFIDFVQRNNMRDNYMSNLIFCEKIFIPVHVEKNSNGHYYLYIIHMKNREVEIWDSLCEQFMDKIERDQTTQKLLLAMEQLFIDVMFTKFQWRMASNIPLQPNGYDCGIFVINYMQQSDNFVRQNPLFQFDSDEERLNLALKLLKSDLNQEKETLYDEAARRHNAQGESEDLGSCRIKRKRIDTCKTIFEDVGRGAYMELDDSDNRAKRNNIALKTECIKGYILPTTDLVGNSVQRNTQQIWEWIMKNEVLVIGIWGMGGAGKTALATHVHNKLLEEADDDFDYIIWVTVSQYDNCIYKLQKAIARSINLDISDECDVKKISGKLLQASKHINGCVLILDDVWNPIFLEEVGFPILNNGIKLILTTRSWEVCQSMNCMKNIINVKPLDEEDGWDLFKRTLGIHQIQASRVEPIARAVANQCWGLPLAIVTIARSMKGKENLREWNYLLECLQNLDNGQYDMDEKVFPVLKSSYACLNNKLQSLFSYYALSSEGYVYDIYVEPFIRRFFYEEWTDETKSLDMQYSEGYAMLDKLKNNSLLIKEDGCWRMHTLLRVMAISIANKTDKIMAKHCMNLIELPEDGKWKENLHKVFLTKSNIQKIPEGTSPKCSKLSTLLLDHNYDLKWIPDDFFSNMSTLKILDLSWTGIEYLPESVSNLKCLIALLLSGCKKLHYVPSLAKLQGLIELDLSFTAITEAPCGLELLVNLKCLNLTLTHQLKMSSSTISKMTNLQSLRLINRIPESMVMRAQDLHGLRKLEVISINFCDIEEFNSYVKSFLDKDRMPKSYCLCSATLFHSASVVGAPEAYSSRRVVLSGIDLANRAAVLPRDINELFISECELKDLKQMVTPFSPSLDSPFLCLIDLFISGCSGMNILMTSGLLAQLQNLETIFIGFCKSMEEIIGEDYCSSKTSNRNITLPKVRSLKLGCLPELTFVFKGTMLCPSLKYFDAFGCKKLWPPHIEIVRGYKLRMEEIWAGYSWTCDNQFQLLIQDSELDD